MRRIPRSGFEAYGRFSSTSARTCRESPGRTGITQRNSSIPGEPSEQAAKTFSDSQRR